MANKNPVHKFKKGESGNPKGRAKKGDTLTDILRALGEIKDIRHKNELITRKEFLGRKLWEMAMSGEHFAAVKYVYDRLDGMPIINQNVKLEDVKIEIFKSSELSSKKQHNNNNEN